MKVLPWFALLFKSAFLISVIAVPKVKSFRLLDKPNHLTVQRRASQVGLDCAPKAAAPRSPAVVRLETGAYKSERPPIHKDVDGLVRALPGR